MHSKYRKAVQTNHSDCERSQAILFGLDTGGNGLHHSVYAV